MAGHRPSRKRTGRSGPPPGYPKNQDSYADPENWKYPVHTPHHAVAARRYFNKLKNRNAYEPEEQLYIDSKINEALRRFGIDPISIPGTTAKVVVQRLIEERIPSNLETASLEECLKFLLGQPRLRRAKAIGDEDLTIIELSQKRVSAKIRAYMVEINSEKKTISHDCADWDRRKIAKKLCKHLGKVLLTLPEDMAKAFVRDFIQNLNLWSLK